MANIKLGYEIKTGREIVIEPSHLIVTGVTQQSGKTTTLESLINRSKKKAVIFRTKIGEKSFLHGTIIPPFFKDRSDWQFIQGLVEATIKEKLRSFERAKIIQLCKQTGGNSILDFKKKIDERLNNEKLNGFEKDILTNIQAYLEIVLPKLQTIKFSNELELVEGLNIIDLERFSRDSEVQSLIIRSVAEEVLNKFKDVILVIPEAWKFLPQGRGNPCKLIIEEFIRQGATNNNFIWIDSQDMSNVDKIPLKQISTWILGYQSERNEVKHTIDQIPLPAAQKPKPDEVMSLEIGHFILASRHMTAKIYVQPFWLDDSRAKKIAMGELKVSEIDAPERITPFKIAVKQDAPAQQPIVDLKETTKNFQKELSEMSNDFFNKIGDLQEQINKVYQEVYNLKNSRQAAPEISEEVIIRKIMQKLPSTPLGQNMPQIDLAAFKKEILASIPASQGSVTYTVAPLEKIKKGFLKDAKERIVTRIGQLSADQKTAIKFTEAKGSRTSKKEIYIAGLGNTSQYAGNGKYSKEIDELAADTLIRQDGTWYYANLKEKIRAELASHNSEEGDVEQLYDHILAELI